MLSSHLKLKCRYHVAFNGPARFRIFQLNHSKAVRPYVRCASYYTITPINFISILLINDLAPSMKPLFWTCTRNIHFNRMIRHFGNKFSVLIRPDSAFGSAARGPTIVSYQLLNHFTPIGWSSSIYASGPINCCPIYFLGAGSAMNNICVIASH